MMCDITRDGESLVVKLDGPLDYKTSPEVENALKDELEGVTDLTVDLASVSYVSSMGLRLLLSLQKRMFKQGQMHVVNVRPEVQQLLDETGFSKIFDIR